MPRGSLFLFVLLLLYGRADHYKTLGVRNSASAAEIKAAFRGMALRHHPDKMPKGASLERRQRSRRIFEEANAAFEVLGDPTKRRQYDYDLANPVQRGEDGIYRQGEPGATPARPVVSVTVRCTMEQLGGWQAAEVSTEAWSTALGAYVSRNLAEKLPMQLWLPPGMRCIRQLKC